MGYETLYHLEWNCDRSKTDWDTISNEIKSRQENDDNFFYGVNPFGESNDSVKWYEHEQDIAAFSKNYPDVLFTLQGEGEAAGDIWKKYFLNGKMQLCQAEITFPAYDKSKLKDIDKN